MKPGDEAAFAHYVVQQAPKYGLDPNAVVAVSIQEGLSGQIGDNGTSFGPFQLHWGGAYPANAPHGSPQAAQDWAWSPAGIDYALKQMSKVAGGQQGKQAVHSIVFKFERPANPQAEYTAAVGALPANDGGPSDNSGGVVGILKGIVGDVLPPGVPNPVSVAQGAGSAVSSAEAVGSFLGDLTHASFWLRALEVMGGLIILLVGVYLLARQVGLAPSATEVARTAATVTPAGRELAAASGGVSE